MYTAPAMPTSEYSLAMWIAGTLLQGAVFVGMLLRNLHRQFPAFFIYTGLQFAVSAAMFLVLRMPADTYFYAYWAIEYLTIVLGFCVIREIFTSAIAEYEGIRRLCDMLFRWCGVMLVLVAAVVAGSDPAGPVQSGLQYFALVERSLRLMQVGLLLFIFLFAGYFRLGWKRHTFGFALGFGVFAAIHLAALSVRMFLGLEDYALIAVAKPLAYNMALVIWAGYVFVPARMPRESDMPLVKSDLDRWDAELSHLIRQQS